MITVDAIFFDIDGTLVDARQDIVNAVNHTLKQLDIAPGHFDEIVSYIGTGVRDLIGKSLRSSDAALIDRAVEIYSSYYMKHPADNATLYPHVKEILEHFKHKRKFILTNRYSRYGEALLEAVGIIGYFERVFGGDDESCIKPFACAFGKILPEVGVDKSAAIMVGDMAVDIMAGKNAGVRTCFVKYGLTSVEEARALEPDYMIDDLMELKNIIR